VGLGLFAGEPLEPGRVRRVVMLTDMMCGGDELKLQLARAAEQGVFTTIVAISESFDAEVTNEVIRKCTGANYFCAQKDRDLEK